MGSLARWWIFLAVMIGPAVGPVFAADVPKDPAVMAQRIDEHLARAWKQAGIEPAPPADDAHLLRRLSLDLTGKIPTVGEARAFLKDASPQKRNELIDHLLARPAHATHLAATWRQFLLPQGADLRRYGGGVQFASWLRGKFADNAPYDQTVRELLLAKGQINQSGPVLFYSALELKPEELAASTSRVFLGVQIQCAQCHDHPFDHWTQNDFWGYAAFFAQLQRPGNAAQAYYAQVADIDQGEVTFPDTEKVVSPKYLGAGGAKSDENQTRREQLADWLATGDNPFFAKATVNRVWALMFGRGIVDPVDDLGSHNSPSHPQLLDELAAYFVQSNFDVRNLLKTLALTRAYQLSSQATGAAPEEHLFARMAIKPLTGEQLYDCLEQAIAKRQTGAVRQGYQQYDQARQAFLTKFATPAGKASEYQGGIPQALTLMNGGIVRNATDLQQSDILVALQAPFFSDEQRVETLFLATLSRKPQADERTQFIKYVADKKSNEAKQAALGDVLWALLNSAEFTLNH